jgi:L-lactate permease
MGFFPAWLMKIFWHTMVRMRLTMVEISFMLGLGYVTRYSGLAAVLALAFTRTGWLYPFRHVPRVAGCRAHGQRHLLQRIVRELAADHVPAARDRSGAHVRSQ